MRKLVLLTVALLLPTAMNLSPAGAAILDLTTVGSWGTINGAIFQQFDGNPTGTGTIDTFVKIQAFGPQEGYNTDGRPVQYNEGTSHQWNHSLLLSNIPIATNGGTNYREFLLDINQNGQTILSLDKIEIYLEATGDLLGHPGNFGSPQYTLAAGGDNRMRLDYSLNGGSGQGDMLAYVPDSLFTGSNQYVYLYSKFGENSVADDGFEEWGHGVDGPIIPEPATILSLGLGSLILLRKRRRLGF